MLRRQLKRGGILAILREGIQTQARISNDDGACPSAFIVAPLDLARRCVLAFPTER